MRHMPLVEDDRQTEIIHRFRRFHGLKNRPMSECLRFESVKSAQSVDQASSFIRRKLARLRFALAMQAPEREFSIFFKPACRSRCSKLMNGFAKREKRWLGIPATA